MNIEFVTFCLFGRGVAEDGREKEILRYDVPPQCQDMPGPCDIEWREGARLFSAAQQPSYSRNGIIEHRESVPFHTRTNYRQEASKSTVLFRPISRTLLPFPFDPVPTPVPTTGPVQLNE